LDIEFRDRFDSLLEKIEESRKRVSYHHIVQIVAVTKYVDSSVIERLLSIGQRAVGESRVQDFEKKVGELSHLPIEWHFIGTLQKNKINKFLQLQPSLFHGLDSVDLAEAIDTRLEDRGEKLHALLQINASREEQKSGVKIEKAVDIYSEISDRFKNIELKGVMTIGRNSENRDEVRKSFRETRAVFDSLQSSHGAKICSMGMSGDFQLAIEEGSNMVRVGSALVKSPQ
jgi:pyridoxal phosphate enzyme (YggS family)